MIREHLFHKRAPADPLFRWRGGDVSRLEALSDAVFAFALTLLVVSLEPPRSFHGLWMTIREFPAFAACFALLIMIWYYHYKFFRRYGLEDFPTVLLNTLLLFLVLLYVYPLKFLFSTLWRGILGDSLKDLSNVPADGPINQFVAQHGMEFTMLFYGLGVVSVFGVFALMNGYAWLKRNQLELDELERYLTIASIRADLITAGIAAASVVMVLAKLPPQFGGFVYFLMPVAHGLNGYWTGRQAEVLQKKLEAAQA